MSDDIERIRTLNELPSRPWGTLARDDIRILLRHIDAVAAERGNLETALRKAEEWLSGWASAESYLRIIRQALNAGTGRQESQVAPIAAKSPPAHAAAPDGDNSGAVSAKLLPCPKCGSPVYSFEHQVTEGLDEDWVECTSEACDYKAMAPDHETLAQTDVVEIPAAFMRQVRSPSTPNDPGEIDYEMSYGDDQPEGKGWMPLYLHPPKVSDAERRREQHSLETIMRVFLRKLGGWTIVKVTDVESVHFTVIEAVDHDDGARVYTLKRETWYCSHCKQLNSAQSDVCGRCERARA